MLSENTLLSSIHTAESQFLERKASCPKAADLKKTLCAFANSTPEGQYSLLLIGVNDDGSIKGVAEQELDQTQKTIIAVGRDDCYPPIPLITQVIRVGEKWILAAIVSHSATKPHFTGHAYRRVGPTSVKADAEEHDNFVVERSDKGRRLLQHKGKPITVTWDGIYSLGAGTLAHDLRDYRVDGCDAFVVKLFDLYSHRALAVPLEFVTISHDMTKDRLRLLIDMPYPQPIASLAAVNAGLQRVVEGVRNP